MEVYLFTVIIDRVGFYSKDAPIRSLNTIKKDIAFSHYIQFAVV